MDKIANLLDKIPYVPSTELKIAFVCALALCVLFLISLLFTKATRIKRLTKQLLATVQKVDKMDSFDAENIGKVYSEIKKMPEGAAKGWEKYLEHQEAFPSDYMTKSEVLGERSLSGKRTFSLLFFVVFGLAVLAAGAFFVVEFCGTSLANIGFNDIANDFSLVASIICTFLISFLFYMIFIISLRFVSIKQLRRLYMVYDSFCEMLDSKAVAYVNGESRFETENLDKVTKSVEDIVQCKLLQDEVVEVVTYPLSANDELDEEEKQEVILKVLVEEQAKEEVQVVEEEIVEPEVEEVIEEPVEEIIEEVEEPVEEVVEEVEPIVEEVVAVTDEDIEDMQIMQAMDEEEKTSFLISVAQIIDAALNDPDEGEATFIELEKLIKKAIDSQAYLSDEDSEILADCVMALESRH